MDDSLDSLKKRLFSGSIWAFIGKLMTSILNVVIAALLVHLLVPEEVGAYFLIFSFVTIAAMIAQLGLNHTVVRLIAESMALNKPGRALKTIRLSLLYSGLASFVVAGLLWLGLAKWIIDNLFNSSVLMNSVIGLTILWVVLTTLQNLVAETFRGFHIIQLATLFSELLRSLLLTLAIFAIWLFYDKSTLEETTLLSVITTGLTVLIAGRFLWKKIKELSSEGEKDLSAKELLNITWPMWLTNLTFFLLIQADIWVLGIFITPEQVAIYGAVSRLVALVSMPLMIVNAVLPPLIAELYAQNRKRQLEQLLRLAATITSIPTFILLAIFTIFSEPLLELVYGEYYRQGSMMLIFLSLGQFVNVWSGSCGLTLMMTGYQKTMMVISIFCGLMTVAGAIWVVEPYGAIGVAAVAGTGIAIQNFLMLIFVKNKLDIWTHTHLISSVYHWVKAR